jgi:hypothetical protein
MPDAFHIGDIMETMVAFVGLPVWGESYIIVPQLRVLTLLESKVHQVCSEN